MSIVSGLDEEDERSEENLDIIANVYENITELLQSGQIMITENVRIIKYLLKSQSYCLLTVCREHCECCEWHF